jgi:LmbE family N-acetylglucosaminyl deacetylase
VGSAAGTAVDGFVASRVNRGNPRLYASRVRRLPGILEELATREPTAAEREQRAREAARELGVEYTPQVEQAGHDAWAKIRAPQGGAAA